VTKSHPGVNNKGNMPGPPKIRTDSARKRQKSAAARRKRAESVRIGEQIDRWKSLKESKSLDDTGLAKVLIDR